MQLALFQAGFTYGMLESGVIKELPKDFNAENLKFWQTHKGEIDGLTALSEKERED